MVFRVAGDAPHAEPRAGTPVGWAETVMAQKRGEYPDDEHARVEGWLGEADGEAHAAAWLDNPTIYAAQESPRRLQPSENSLNL